jgi:hypothetical protein
MAETLDIVASFSMKIHFSIHKLRIICVLLDNPQVIS